MVVAGVVFVVFVQKGDIFAGGDVSKQVARIRAAFAEFDAVHRQPAVGTVQVTVRGDDAAFDRGTD
jgi:hypothetical protein